MRRSSARPADALDGDWAWEDTDAAYLLLDSLVSAGGGERPGAVAVRGLRALLHRAQAASQFALLIVDEFSALADALGMAARVEQARGFNTSLVLAPQVVAGMGDEAETARILGSVETVICHRVNTPEDIIALAGTVQRLDYSSQFEHAGATGAGSARLQHHYKIDPNEVRSLPPGEAYVIARGKAMRIRVSQAPAVSGRLPEPEPLVMGRPQAGEKPASVEPPAEARELDY